MPYIYTGISLLLLLLIVVLFLSGLLYVKRGVEKSSSSSEYAVFLARIYQHHQNILNLEQKSQNECVTPSFSADLDDRHHQNNSNDNSNNGGDDDRDNKYRHMISPLLFSLEMFIYKSKFRLHPRTSLPLKTIHPNFLLLKHNSNNINNNYSTQSNIYYSSSSNNNHFNIMKLDNYSCNRVLTLDLFQKEQINVKSRFHEMPFHMQSLHRHQDEVVHLSSSPKVD